MGKKFIMYHFTDSFITRFVEKIWPSGFLLASARQKPVDNRATFFLLLLFKPVYSPLLCYAMDAPKWHDNFVGNNS